MQHALSRMVPLPTLETALAAQTIARLQMDYFVWLRGTNVLYTFVFPVSFGFFDVRSLALQEYRDRASVFASSKVWHARHRAP